VASAALPSARRSAVAALAVLGVLLLPSCGTKKTPPADTATTSTPEESAAAALPAQALVAVLPMEPAKPPESDGRDATLPSEDAGLAVTAQIYRVLADQTEFRVVPDLTVVDVLTTPEVRRAGGVVERAIALGKEVGADDVIFGRVYRFDKRVGTAYVVTQPASVWFELGLVHVSSGEVVWKGEFDETQGPLGSRLMSWIVFWRDTPHWYSASELAGVGVDRLFDGIVASVEKSG
jgi:hypothetical protein